MRYRKFFTETGVQNLSRAYLDNNVKVQLISVPPKLISAPPQLISAPPGCFISDIKLYILPTCISNIGLSIL